MSGTLTIATYPSVRIPGRATASLASFREWAQNNDLPEKTRTDYYKGEILIDMSKGQIFTHGAVKTEIAAVLQTLCKQTGLGRHWCNGILVTNEDADLSGNPDGTFVSHASLTAGHVTLTKGAESGFVGGEEAEFHIYKLGAKRYSAIKKQPGGWLKSSSFARSFRLVRGLDASKNPEFTLEVK